MACSSAFNITIGMGQLLLSIKQTSVYKH